MKRIKLFILYLSVSLVLAGCGSSKKRSIGTMETPTRKVSKEELRDRLNIYREQYFSRLTQIADVIDTQSDSRVFQKNNLRLRTKINKAMDAMLAPDDPVEAFIETWGFTLRMRFYLQEGEGSTLYGEYQPMLTDFATNTEAEIEHIGRLFLDAKQFESARSNLIHFANQNPIKGVYGNLNVMAVKSIQEEGGPIDDILRIPLSPFRAMEGVDRTASAIGKVSDAADRFTNVVQELPESTRWEAVMLMEELNESPMTVSLLNSMATFSNNSTRMVQTAEEMPQAIRKEMTILLKELEETQSGLQKTLEASTQTSIEIRRAAEVLNEFIKLFISDKKGKPKDPDAPPGFGMRDFDTMVNNIGDTAGQIQQTILEIQRTLNSSATDNVGAVVNQSTLQVRSMVNHIAWRLIQVILVFFVVLFVYRLTVRKISVPKQKLKKP